MPLSLPVTNEDRDRFVAAFDRLLLDRVDVLEYLRYKVSGTSIRAE